MTENEVFGSINVFLTRLDVGWMWSGCRVGVGWIWGGCGVVMGRSLTVCA